MCCLIEFPLSSFRNPMKISSCLGNIYAEREKIQLGLLTFKYNYILIITPCMNSIWLYIY